MSRDEADMETNIHNVETTLHHLSTADILWGGPRGDGLVHTVARLSVAVESLGHTVNTLAGQVTGSDGVQAQVAALKIEMARFNSWFRIVAIGAGTVGGSGLAWLVGRSIQIAIQGHV